MFIDLQTRLQRAGNSTLTTRRALGLGAWLFAFAILLAGCAHKPSFDEQTLAIKQSPHKTLAIYTVNVTPASYWLRETRRQYTKREVDTLIERYQTLLSNTFNDEMVDAGWQLDANSPLKATLEINHFRVSAPDIKGALTDLYAQDELGSATFTLSLFEGEALVAKFVDRRDVPTMVPGKLEPTNRVTNQRGFKRELEQFLRDCNGVLKPVFQLP